MPAGQGKKRPDRDPRISGLAEAWAQSVGQATADRAKNELVKIAGHLRPDQLKQHTVNLITDAWKSRLSRTTRYLWSGQLRRLLRFLKRDDLRVAKSPTPLPRTTIATPEEIERLLTIASPWMKLVVMLASTEGLRRSDCLRVAPANYDRERQTITIIQKKTERSATLPVPPRLAQTLEATPCDPLDKTPYVVLLRAGKPISAVSVQFAWQRLKKQAGVRRDLWIHDLRRTLAVSLYEVSKDLRVVEHMLGHTNLTSTARYLEHRDPEKLRTILNSLWTPKGPVQ